MRFLLIIIFVTISLEVFSQGKLTLSGEKGIETIVSEHIYFNENVKGFPGYRVQIFFESGNYSRNKALGEKSKFMSRYPNIQAYMVYQEPYYKIRVGNFRNRLDAKSFVNRIKDEWTGAYIIKDDIEIPTISKPEKYK